MLPGRVARLKHGPDQLHAMRFGTEVSFEWNSLIWMCVTGCLIGFHLNGWVIWMCFVCLVDYSLLHIQRIPRMKNTKTTLMWVLSRVMSQNKRRYNCKFILKEQVGLLYCTKTQAKKAMAFQNAAKPTKRSLERAFLGSVSSSCRTSHLLQSLRRSQTLYTSGGVGWSCDQSSRLSKTKKHGGQRKQLQWGRKPTFVKSRGNCKSRKMLLCRIQRNTTQIKLQQMHLPGKWKDWRWMQKVSFMCWGRIGWNIFPCARCSKLACLHCGQSLGVD